MHLTKVSLLLGCIILVSIAIAVPLARQDSTVTLPLAERQALTKQGYTDIEIQELGCVQQICTYLLTNKVTLTYTDRKNITHTRNWQETLHTFSIDGTDISDAQLIIKRDAEIQTWVSTRAKQLIAEDRTNAVSRVGDGNVIIR
jgi:hypothetical protein